MDATTPPLISAIASTATAVTAVVGFIYAIGKTSKEIERTRNEKRIVKRAEVAGEVMVATLRYLTALDSVVSIYSNAQKEPDDDPRDEHAPMRGVTNKLWISIGDVSNAFIRAWELAETYLPRTVDELLQGIWQLRAEIRAGQHTFFAVPLGQGSEFFKQGWGKMPEAAIKQVREKAHKLLRPIAQLESEDGSGSSLRGAATTRTE